MATTKETLRRGANRFGRFVRGIVSIPLLVAATVVATAGYAAVGTIVAAVIAGQAYLSSSFFSSDQKIPNKENILDKLYRWSK